MRLLHLLWPHLPLRLARSRLGSPGSDGTSVSWPPGPIVLGGQPWTDGTVVDADPLARALGVRRGIPLGSAHRLAPEATFLDLAPEADRDAVEAACERLAAFSPGIAGTSDVTDPTFGRLAVHVDGLTRLWGIEETLVARIGDALAPAAARPAAGGHRRHELRRQRRRRPCVRGRPADPRPARRRWPVPRPVSRPPAHPRRRHPGAPRPLRPADDRLGRGAAAVGRWWRASGTRGRGCTPGPGARRRSASGHAAPPERFALALPLDPPAEGLDAVRFVLHRLAATLADQLQARGQAAGLARLVITHDLAFARRGTPPILDLEQRLPEPTADAEAIERLLFARLEKVPPPAAVARLELELARVEAATGQQLPLFTPQAARDARLAWQLARLAIAFGTDRVHRVEITDPEASIAEARWRWMPVAGASVTGEAAPVTRLLREHPAIDAELDGDGRLVAIRWNGRRESGGGVQPLAGRGVVVAGADRAGLLQGRRAAAGSRSCTSIGSPGSWHLERLFD